MNFQFVPSFAPAQQSPIFPLQSHQPPFAPPTNFQNYLTLPQPQQNYLLVPQLTTTPEHQTATTTATTATTSSTQQDQTSKILDYSSKIVSVVPFTPSDNRVPNQTFEVLKEVHPIKNSLSPFIPTTFVAVDTPTRALSFPSLDISSVPKFKSSKGPSGTDTSRDSNSDLISLVSENQSLLVNEIRVYKGPPIVRWLFLVVGLLQLLLGILAFFWCRPSDQYYYCRIWGAIALAVFGIIGYAQRGNYLAKWENILFIIFGLITSSMVLACLCFVMVMFCHRVIEIFQFTSWANYIEEIKWRMVYLRDMPIANLTVSGQPFPEANEVACLTIDGISVFLDIFGFLIIVSTTLVIDKFYSSFYVVTQKVQPFNSPKLFNPYGQVFVGEVQIFLGFLLQCVVYGNESQTWQKILAPVFSGIVPIIAGIVAALALKSSGINSKLWEFLAIVLELVSLLLTAIAIILITIGLSENVQTFQSQTMTQSQYSRSLMIFSVFAFGTTDIICLISFFYSIAVLICLFICTCCHKKVNSESIPQWHDDGNDYREVQKLLLKLSRD